MFNRKFVTETKLVNTKKETPTSINLTPAPAKPSMIEKITKRDVVQATIGAVGVYASVKMINAFCTIAVDYASKM